MGNFQLFPIPISMFIYLNFMKLHYPPYQPIISLSIFYPLIHNLKPISSPNKSKLTEISLPNHNDCNETLSITFLAKLIVLWAALFHSLSEKENRKGTAAGDTRFPERETASVSLIHATMKQRAFALESFQRSSARRYVLCWTRTSKSFSGYAHERLPNGKRLKNMESDEEF